MRILVTGATGFLGTTLCEYLRRAGHSLTPLSSRTCDLTRSDSLAAYTEERYDQIYHLAAWTQAGDFCLHHPGEQWIINEKINANTLGWWQKYQPQAKLICIGTSCAYAPDLELVEQNYLLGSPIDSLFTYAMTKRMQYIGLVALNKQFDLRYLCVVPSTLYGPGYHTDGRQMHFIFDIIRKILGGKFHDEPVVLWGDGYQRRELVFIDDFVAATHQLACNVDNELVNIGAGEEFTIRHFAQLVCEHVGYDFGKIQFDTSRYVGAKSKCLDTAKLNRMLPAWEKTPLSVGLQRTITWMEANQNFLSVGKP
jgi:GDP-L-fucose synthase